MPHSDQQLLLGEVQGRLAALASADVARGQDAYFKGVIKHRGVQTPAVDTACKQFLQTTVVQPAELRQLGLALLREPLQEDKMAGMNILKHCLLRGNTTAAAAAAAAAACWQAELQELEGLYSAGHVFAWSTCDAICGRLLAPLAKLLLKELPGDGEACSRAIMSWHQAGNLWLRRSSVVAFVTLARQPDTQVFPGFRAALLDTLAVTVQGHERFVQTGTGWVLREVGKGDAGQLLQFVEAHLPHFTSEGLRYALEQQPAVTRQRLYALHKQGQQAQQAVAAVEAAGPRARSRRRQQPEQGPSTKAAAEAEAAENGAAAPVEAAAGRAAEGAQAAMEGEQAAAPAKRRRRSIRHP